MLLFASSLIACWGCSLSEARSLSGSTASKMSLLVQVQDTLTSVREQPLKTTLRQLLMPFAAALLVLLTSYGAARLFQGSPSNPVAFSSLPPPHLDTLQHENQQLWQQLNDTRAALEQGQFRCVVRCSSMNAMSQRCSMMTIIGGHCPTSLVSSQAIALTAVQLSSSKMASFNLELHMTYTPATHCVLGC